MKYETAVAISKLSNKSICILCGINEHCFESAFIGDIEFKYLENKRTCDLFIKRECSK